MVAYCLDKLKKLVVILLNLEKLKKLVVSLPTLGKSEKLLVNLLTCLKSKENLKNLFYSLETSTVQRLFCGTTVWRLSLQSTVWRLFYDVENFIAAYGVETFLCCSLRCGEFRCKQLLTMFKLVSPQVGRLTALRSARETYSSGEIKVLLFVVTCAFKAFDCVIAINRSIHDLVFIYS